MLIEAAIEPEVARQQPIDFMTAVQQSSFTYTPSLNTDTFEELRATGGLGLLRDEALRSALFEYHRYDTSQRQYLSLQLMTEFRHLELAAGILTNEQYVWKCLAGLFSSPTCGKIIDCKLLEKLNGSLRSYPNHLHCCRDLRSVTNLSL